MQKELSVCCSGCVIWVWSSVVGCDEFTCAGGVGGVWVVGLGAVCAEGGCRVGRCSVCVGSSTVLCIMLLCWGGVVLSVCEAVCW